MFNRRIRVISQGAHLCIQCRRILRHAGTVDIRSHIVDGGLDSRHRILDILTEQCEGRIGGCHILCRLLHIDVFGLEFLPRSIHGAGGRGYCVLQRMIAVHKRIHHNLIFLKITVDLLQVVLEPLKCRIAFHIL